MANSYVTERALAQTLKELMKKTSLNKITVQDITDQCGVSRRTFYNHFNDTYELLGWIYEHEVIENLEQYYTLDGWKQGISMVLQYTLENKEICLNTFHSLGRDYLERFLYRIFYGALKGVVNDITKDMEVQPLVKEESIQFYTLAIIGEFILWLRNGLKETPELVAQRLIRQLSGTLSNLMGRLREV